MKNGRALGTHDVARLSGLTFRQVDYYVRTNILTPTWMGNREGSGGTRLWTEEDLEAARLIKQLLDEGVTLERIRNDGDPRKTVKKMSEALSRLTP